MVVLVQLAKEIIVMIKRNTNHLTVLYVRSGKAPDDEVLRWCK